MEYYICKNVKLFFRVYPFVIVSPGNYAPTSGEILESLLGSNKDFRIFKHYIPIIILLDKSIKHCLLNIYYRKSL